MDNDHQLHQKVADLEKWKGRINGGITVVGLGVPLVLKVAWEFIKPGK